jgi:cytochrome b pre-mRNA-processing protein 3
MVLALRALRTMPPPGDEVAKDLTDAFFRDLDASLREMGVGDTSVPKRMKKLGEAFYGRAHAYDGALNAGDASTLAAALCRNVIGTSVPSGPLARYALAADASFASLSLETVLEHGFSFPLPQEFAGEGMP